MAHRLHSLMRKRPFFLVFLIPTALLALVFLIALAEILQYSLRQFIPGSLDVGGFTLENFTRINRPVYLWAVLDTFWLSFLTAGFSLILSYPLAYALVRTRSEVVRTMLIVLAITPLFTGEIVRTYAWLLLLGSEGMLNTVLKTLGVIDTSVRLLYTRTGVVVALVQFAMPVMIILLSTAIAHVNIDYEKAAANLGASPSRVFWRITVPLTMPGILAGWVTICAWTMSAFATPQLVGGGKILMISNIVYLQGFSSLNFPFAASLSLIALASALGTLTLLRVVSGRIERRTEMHG
jgi:putative spermidine/putrescine transport system permease protein